MHIEPGVLAQTKILAANVAASGVLLAHLPALARRPALWLRTLLAAVFFSLFMQSFHMAVGPSELHFIGAMPIYLLLGYLPTLFGFALGLALQGLLFEPQDLLHLAVNTLSLVVPLTAVHFGIGRRLSAAQVSEARVATVLRLDAAYYAGVTAMVGFWLAIGQEATPLADWARFASSYLVLVALEPVFTLLIVRAVRRWREAGWARACLDERLTAAA
ncbi:energy-coupling factor ABC transporter permease [Rubrivivax benzoatilyticus]|uniref:Energy-coupling factor ABC transporter permease n=1 Tax=Rubrivivax benzoatilyticus TaxID=316997 RepID=A0ABX0HYJ8_9BURK|nr:energy-coupling factor ABC transporter permease [Rubrivivax benzoatilyticus]EGJ09173.1 cobalamin (vitamin B12) biosynthesis CbiM protein [Rubrivivax benzoatilyticus JA2 = ATCC BAA-35]NHL00068.1 energy-coupling factor ABC transporter permease [Rubrivivax benzoatilyticus]NHL25916.1 energy-coupling factor ABC transporter permease [Rubrivivax benzoatilyticus]